MRSGRPGRKGFRNVPGRGCSLAVAVAVLLVVGCGLEAPPPLTGSMHFYVEVQQALAADDFARAVEGLGTLQNLVGEEDAGLVRAAAAGADIEAVRRAFKPLSEALVAKVQIPAGYGVAFCPMADDDRGARWIQKRGRIANPYFGASMLMCGEFADQAQAEETAGADG